MDAGGAAARDDLGLPNYKSVSFMPRTCFSTCTYSRSIIARKASGVAGGAGSVPSAAKRLTMAGALSPALMTLFNACTHGHMQIVGGRHGTERGER